MQAEIQVRRQPDQRREERQLAHHEGEIGPAGSDTFSAIVTDLSPSGCRVVVDQPLAAESVIWLRVGGHGPFMARVVWYDGTAAGCEFAGTLHPNVVSSLLEG